MNMFFKNTLVVMFATSLMACSGSNDVGEDETLVLSKPSLGDVSLEATTQEDILPASLDVPEGTRAVTEYDIIDHWVDLSDDWPGWAFNISRIEGVVGEIAIKASGLGYPEREYIVDARGLRLDEAVDPVSNDTIGQMACTEAYGFAKAYIYTDGPELHHDYLAITCEGGRYNTAQIEYHYVSDNGEFSIHGDLDAYGSALVTLNLHDLLVTEGTVYMAIAGVDANGNEIGLHYDEYLVELHGRDSVSGTFPLSLHDFGGEYLRIRAQVCRVGQFNEHGYCIDQCPPFIAEIGMISLNN